MKYYLMARKVHANSTLLDQKSHQLVEFSTGRPFPESFEGPLVVTLDEDFIDGEMATFYMSPAVIGKKTFHQDLADLGIDNIEVVPAIIRDQVRNRDIHDYVLMNIIGRVSCADMTRSDYSELGDGMNVIDKLVIDPSKTEGQELFLVHEDTDCIVVSERIYKRLQEKGYPDIHFERIESA